MEKWCVTKKDCACGNEKQPLYNVNGQGGEVYIIDENEIAPFHNFAETLSIGKPRRDDGGNSIFLHVRSLE